MSDSCDKCCVQDVQFLALPCFGSTITSQMSQKSHPNLSFSLLQYFKTFLDCPYSGISPKFISTV